MIRLPKSRVLRLTLLLVMIGVPQEAVAYLAFSVPIGGRSTDVRWRATPVRWLATDRAAAGVSASAFQSVMTRAFETWQAVPTASIAFSFVGFTSARPLDDDGLSVLGFEFTPELERVLGSTSFLLDSITGEIVEADILFNSTFAWSASAVDPSRFDLESVALHEIGHLIGLGHSALGETELRPDGRRVLASGSVMFPIAFGRGNTLDRTLQPDDIAGVSDLYPAGDFRSRTGVARGRVLRDGRGVFGAHIVAFNPRTGDVIAGFTVNAAGEFEIAGLTPGPHIIRVEPLDDADIESFFSRRDPVDANFQVTFYERLFVAPAGGVGERFDVNVKAK